MTSSYNKLFPNASNATALNVTAPDISAPDATAPDATAPDATAPNATAADALADRFKTLTEVAERLTRAMSVRNTAVAKVPPAKRNALAHGVYSSDLVLPWEREEDLENLHAGFRVELAPIGCAEDQAVLDLTRWTWLKRRVIRMAQLAAHQDPFAIAMLKSGKKSWDEVLDHQHSASQDAENALLAAANTLSMLNLIMLDIRKIPFDPQSKDGKSDQSEVRRLVSAVSSLTSSIEQTVVPSIQKWNKIVDENDEMFKRAYDPDCIEKQVRLEAAIDARIEKVMFRLTAIKEAKRIFASHAPKPAPTISLPIAPPIEAAASNKPSHDQ